ncbi:MAG: permease [Verrucomicrobiota bacterium]
MIDISGYLWNVWGVFTELAPWLLFGTLVGGILHAFMPRDFVRRHLGKGSFSNVVKAVMFGVPMPLCSCGVIPTAIGLKRDGASKGAAVGFLISTPQTGVDSVVVSSVFLGLPFAIFKVISAFITGITGGVIVNAITRDEEHFKGDSASEVQSSAGLSAWGRLKKMVDFGLNDLLRSIWKWVVVGVLISAAISTIVEPGTLADNPLTSGLTGMLMMLVISLPFYVCATASVPIAASLVLAGMPTGAALVFLMAGPATNLATLGAVMREFGKKVALVYVLVIAVFSLVLGVIYNRLIGGHIPVTEGELEHGSAFGVAGAVILVALFVFFLLSDLRENAS